MPEFDPVPVYPFLQNFLSGTNSAKYWDGDGELEEADISQTITQTNKFSTA